LSEYTHDSWGRRAAAWIISAVIHALIVVVLASLVLVVVQQPPLEAVVRFEPVGRPDDPSAASSGGSAPRVETTSNTSSSPSVAPLPAPSVDAAIGSTPAPDQSVVPTDSTVTDPALALLAELTEELSAEHSGRGDNPLIDGVSEGFQQMVGGIRGRGLDVVFVIDATNSMEGVIAQAKERANDIIGVITGVLAKDGKPPHNIRFGVVAYKDYGDEYGIAAAKAIALTNDFDAVRDFIDQIIVGGGGDIPEPIHDALKAATSKKMGWTRKARSIIVLIGDSPVHPGGRRDAVNQSRGFVNKYLGVVNVIDVGTGHESVLQDFADIAMAGNGTASLLASEEAFWEDLVVSVFGKRFEQDVRIIVERYAKYR
jgi:VWA domain-containing protein